ncbi:hypothetical protein D3C81_537240 [compost metagenome]
MSKYVEVRFYNNDEKRFYDVSEGLTKLGVDEDNNWVPDDLGFFCEGFHDGSKWITNHESDTEYFNEVDLEVIFSDTDFYGTGIDSLTVSIDGEVSEVLRSRWQGSTGYYYIPSEHSVREDLQEAAFTVED